MEDEEVGVEARRMKKKVAVVSGCRRVTAWVASPGLDSTQVVPEHISHFLCTLEENYGLYEGYRHTSIGT